MAGTEVAAIIIATLGVVGGILTAAVKFSGDYMLKKLEIREAKAKEASLKEGVKNVSAQVKSTALLEIICKEIRNFVGATKCNVWMFHNGGYYYTGSPIQRISMVARSLDEVDDEFKSKFVNMPIGLFSRNLQKLNQDRYVHEKNELAYNDTLGIINSQYHVTSSALFKIMSQDGEDWVGLLALGWHKHNTLTEKEIAYIEARLLEITRLLSPKLID